MVEIALTALFWISAALLAYTFVGYRLLIGALPARGLNPLPASGNLLSVTVVVVAHNEVDRIAKRLHNLLASDYPPAHLAILLVTDGCSDGTAEAARAITDQRISILELPERHGKPHGINAAVAQSSSDLIVFADARQSFAPDTITKLAAGLTDPKIGAISGDLHIEGAMSGVGRAVDSYWKWEKGIRRSESRFDSCIGCTGAVYAIRRELFRPLPDDTILDDVVIPMQIALQGWRVIHEEAAIAFDPQTLEPERERLRKKRTLAGNFQMLWRYPSWLLPSRNRLWWQLLSHKYLRLASPALLVLTFASSAALAGTPMFRLAFTAQCVFYGLAMVGLTFPALQFRVLSLPAGFVFLNARVAEALLYYVQTRDEHGWSSSRT